LIKTLQKHPLFFNIYPFNLHISSIWEEYLYTKQNVKESIMNRKLRTISLIVLPLILVSSILSGCSTSTTSAATTGVVTAYTMSSTIDTSGTISAKQLTTLSWGTSGIVGSVNVSVNDEVKADDIVMALDPTTAPSDVIAANETLTSAKQALEDAQQSNTSSAAAEKALADAQSAYNTALANYWNATDGGTIGTEEQIKLYQAKYYQAQNNVTDKQKIYNKYKDLDDSNNDKAKAQEALQQAIIARDEAKATMDYYMSTPSPADIQDLKAALDVAKAALEDAQRAYDRVKDGPNADDIASAQAQVDAAQATVNLQYVIAPFDGEVAAILTQEGDQVAEGDSAIIIVNRSTLYVDVSIDETDISRVKLGDTATITFDASPDITATGKVTFINPVGASSSGVVNYTVRVTLDASDPAILLGATATIEIDTGAAESLLTVPVAAVMTDDSGNEYVIRVKSDGSTEQVAVTSGTVVGTSVVVTGDLAAGDVVELNSSTTSATATSSSSGLNILGGGGGMPSGGMPSGGGPGQ
jgi:HlyD family secretion protein